MIKIVAVIAFLTINSGVLMGQDFVCFKDYPRTAKADIKEIKVGTDLPEWDLSYLYADYKDKRIFADLNNALKMSESFKKKYENPLTKEKLSATQLNKAIIEYESVLQKMILPEGYLANKHSIELGNEELNALLGKAEIISAQIAKNVSFFENGLSRTSANYKKKIFKDKTLIVYANFLDKQAARQKHILPEDHEQLLIDKDVNGVSAWSKFRTIFESKYSFQFQGPEDKSPRAYTLSELTNLLQNDKRDV
jgi:oligoendopeptidase F